jgi:hypothetical protein
MKHIEHPIHLGRQRIVLSQRQAIGPGRIFYLNLSCRLRYEGLQILRLRQQWKAVLPLLPGVPYVRSRDVRLRESKSSPSFRAALDSPAGIFHTFARSRALFIEVLQHGC